MAPDVDAGRQHFRAKAKGMVDKVTTVSEAVSRLIHDGDYIAIGGFGTNRIPTAVLHEIVRQGKRHLGVSGAEPRWTYTATSTPPWSARTMHGREPRSRAAVAPTAWAPCAAAPCVTSSCSTSGSPPQSQRKGHRRCAVGPTI